jgi:hypothetical protein
MVRIILPQEFYNRAFLLSNPSICYIGTALSKSAILKPVSEPGYFVSS